LNYDPGQNDTFSGHLTNETIGLSAGSKVGVYTLVEPLGQGGMGQVWKANDGKRAVALKLLPPEFRGNADAIAQVDEAFQVVHALTHQHICKTLGLFNDQQHGPFLVLDYIPGIRLSQFQKQGNYAQRRVPLEIVIQILRPIAEALDYAHQKYFQHDDREQQGVLHRDVKPDNILIVVRDGIIRDVLLIDFGLAAEIRNTINKHTNGSADSRGTRHYMSPEQLKGKRHLWDGRTDQYSLAVVAYELLAGHLPFDCDDEFSLMLAITQEPPDPIDGLPDNVNDALRRGLAKDKTARFSSCVKLVQALSGKSVTPDRPSIVTPAPKPEKAPTGTFGKGAKAGDVQVLRFNNIEIPFCWCPPGKFKMGSPPSEIERGAYEDRVGVESTQGFWMGQTVVTQELYEAVMGSNPSQFKGPMRPVENVSWRDANEFCRRLTNRVEPRNELQSNWQICLPTTAQWEYACRAGVETRYSFGNSTSELSYSGWFKQNSGDETRDVSLLRPNNWGLYDMHGNVWEWCADLHSNHEDDNRETTYDVNTTRRARRGGSWKSNAQTCSAERRSGIEPHNAGYDLGFRVCIISQTS